MGRTALVTGVSRRQGIGFAIAWNTPDEAASVVALLLSPEAATVTGQVVDAEAGFRRFTP